MGGASGACCALTVTVGRPRDWPVRRCGCVRPMSRSSPSFREGLIPFKMPTELADGLGVESLPRRPLPVSPCTRAHLRGRCGRRDPNPKPGRPDALVSPRLPGPGGLRRSSGGHSKNGRTGVKAENAEGTWHATQLSLDNDERSLTAVEINLGAARTYARGPSSSRPTRPGPSRSRRSLDRVG